MSRDMSCHITFQIGPKSNFIFIVLLMLTLILVLNRNKYKRKVWDRSANFRKCLFGTNCPLQQNQIHIQDKTTVDLKDVLQHEKLLDLWWDENGGLKGLHSMNLFRVPFVRDGILQCAPNEENATPLTNKKVLDVGCGGGILSEGLAYLGANVTGIDAGKELIELATKHSKMNPKLSKNCPSYICTSIEEHCQERKSYYDAVIASEVIEHVYNKELFVEACTAALKPGGRIFFTTPNKSRATQFFGIFIGEYVLNFVPRGTHQYDKFMTAPELTFLLEKNNCPVEMTYGLIYNPFTNRWKITKSQLIMFAMQAVKLKEIK